MEQSIFRQDLFGWMIALVVGLPAVLIVLGELIERLQERGNPLVQGLRQVRHVVVPILALLIVLRQILGLSGAASWSRMIETLFWFTAVYASLTLVKNIGRLGECAPETRVNRIPILFFALARAAIVFFVATHILSGIWGFELGKVSIAVGIGTMGIALALQDTLSNLVSGFLLLADRPFRIGDWCLIDGNWLAVKQIGWRTTRFESPTLGMVIIPNGSLGKREITNHGREGNLYKWRLEVKFSYDDPPNRVIRVIDDVLTGIAEIIRGSWVINMVDYGDFAIAYRVAFSIDFGQYGAVRTKFYSQLYYAAKRNGLTFAFPIRQVHHYDMAMAQTPVEQPSQLVVTTLQAIPIFQALPLETLHELASDATIRHYGMGEQIVRQGESDEGLYIIHSGNVTLAAHARDGQTHEILHLAWGDIFGEMALLQGELSPVTATAIVDTQLIIIDHGPVTNLLGAHQQFAMAINIFVEERQRVIRAILGQEDVVSQQTARRELLDLLVSNAARNGNE